MPQHNISTEAKHARWDDGLHFTPVGYDELAQVIYQVILAATPDAACGRDGVAQGRALKRSPQLLASLRTDVR
jgi:hypothetical protein